MRNYVTITVGDCLAFKYNERVYEIAILEVRPVVGGRKAVMTVETDLQVDFSAPVGYQEQPVVGGSRASAGQSLAGSLGTSCVGGSSDGSKGAQSNGPFAPFSGPSNRLFPGSASTGSAATSSTTTTTTATMNTTTTRTREVVVPKNTLVFTRPATNKPTDTKDDKKGFSAFTGTANKL
jgi:ubiquitin fusion degradation protein 1